MQNIRQLRADLLENYEKLKDGTMPLKQGKELANTAGKILSSVKLELTYNAMMERKREIEFLENRDCNETDI
jgi:hypothetical protein